MEISLKQIGIVALVVGALWLGFTLESRHNQKAAGADSAKTAVQVKAIAKAEKQEVTYVQTLAKRAPILAADDSEVERLEKAERAPDPLPPATAVPGREPVALPPVVVADPLIAALRKDLTDTQAQLHTMTLDRDAYKADADAKGLELADLHASLAVQPRPRSWAAGLVYGTDSTLGAYVSRDLGVLQVGLDVVRRPIAGGTTLEAIGTAGFRF